MTKLETQIKNIINFGKARGWNPTPSDLAKSISIEAAELLEKFQWDETDYKNGKSKPKNWEEIGEEVADVFWYLVSFCSASNLNLVEIVNDKAKKNEKKYPVHMFKNKHNYEFYVAQKKKYRETRKDK